MVTGPPLRFPNWQTGILSAVEILPIGNYEAPNHFGLKLNLYNRNCETVSLQPPLMQRQLTTSPWPRGRKSEETSSSRERPPSQYCRRKSPYMSFKMDVLVV